MKKPFFLLWLLAALLLSGCESKETNLVGKWQTGDARSLAEFSQDGTCIISMLEGIMLFEGTYQQLNNYKVVIHINSIVADNTRYGADVFGSEQKIHGDLKGNKLSLTLGRETIVWNRVK